MYPRDKKGHPLVTTADASNPWWVLLTEAVVKAGGKLDKPEIFPASTDARYVRKEGIIAFGFSPMANTPVLLHDHNEVSMSTFLGADARALTLHCFEVWYMHSMRVLKQPIDSVKEQFILGSVNRCNDIVEEPN